MADLFSIIGFVDSSLGGIIKAKEWLDGIRRAPQSIQALSVELRAIESLLRELGTLLSSFNSATRDQAGRLARDAVRNCETMLRQIDVLLRPFVTVDSHTSITTWKRFAFTFRESDITQLRREMESCKQTLNMAISCANLLATQNVDRRVKKMQRHFGIASSSVAGSDSGGQQFEWTEQWILEAEALVEDESENEIPESIQPAPVARKDPVYGERLVMAVTPATYAEHTGPGIAAFDADPEQNPAAPRHYTVQKTALWSEIVDMIAGDIGHDPRLIRLWFMLERPDKTILPTFPILKGRKQISLDTSKVDLVRGVLAVRVWVELAPGLDQDGQAIFPGYIHGAFPSIYPPGILTNAIRDTLLLLLKWYNEKIGKFQNFGHIYVTVNWDTTLADLKSTIQMHMSRAPGVLIDGNIAILREYNGTHVNLELESPDRLSWHSTSQVKIICVKLLDHKFGMAN